MGTYKIYLRSFSGSVLEKTITPSPVEAEAAFRALMKRRELWCTPNAAVLALDNIQLEFRRFDYIVPADSELATLVKHKKPIPDYPRYLYPGERNLMDKHHDDKKNDHYITCYFQVDHRGCPFIDDEKPVRLFPHDPEN